MKKHILLAITSLLLFVIPQSVYADTQFVPHVMLGNLLKVEVSGNKNIQLADFVDVEANPSDGFDVKGGLERIYNDNATVSDMYQPDEVTKSKMNSLLGLAGENMPEDVELKAVLPYQNFNEKTWADIKFRFLQDDASSSRIALLPKGKMIDKPVSANTIPSAKTGLLNPKNPVIIETFDNKITLAFHDAVAYNYQARLLDSKGKELGRVSSSTNSLKPSGIDIRIPNGTKNYYVEYRDNSKYCYILLKVTPDTTRPKEDKTITKAIEEMKAAGAKGEKVAESYMKKKNITDANQLTEKDKQEIANQSAREQAASSNNFHALSQIEIVSKYMREHNIISMAALTEKDMKAISGLIMENAILSWPQQQREVVDDYMKQHNITSYRNLTEKDMNAITKLVKQQVSQMEKASSKKTKTTKRTSK